MEGARLSETLLSYVTTLRQNSENPDVNHHRENLMARNEKLIVRQPHSMQRP